jgi:hypothetical protein
MASIRKEILIEARAENVWAAVRDVGALHRRASCRASSSTLASKRTPGS